LLGGTAHTEPRLPIIWSLKDILVAVSTNFMRYRVWNFLF